MLILRTHVFKVHVENSVSTENQKFRFKWVIYYTRRNDRYVLFFHLLRIPLEKFFDSEIHAEYMMYA